MDKYVYRVCPYRSAEQKDGGMSTQLGSWKEFRDGYRTMVFEGGQQCWNGPPRSIKVGNIIHRLKEQNHTLKLVNFIRRTRMDLVNYIPSFLPM